MKKYILIIILLRPFVCNSFNLIQLDRSNSIQSKSIFYGFQSKQTNLYWFSTKNGISSFDGNMFESYEKQNPNYGIPTIKVIEDNIGFVWFYTSLGEIGYFDGVKFCTPSFESSDRLKIKNNVIEDLFIDDSGELFVLCRNIIFSEIYLYKLERIENTKKSFKIKTCAIIENVVNEIVFYSFNKKTICFLNHKSKELFINVFEDCYFSKNLVVELKNQKLFIKFKDSFSTINSVNSFNRVLYISTSKGIYKVNSKGNVKKIQVGYNVSSTFFDIDSNLFILTQNDGIFLHQKNSKNTIKEYKELGIVSFLIHNFYVYFIDKKFNLNIINLKNDSSIKVDNVGERFVDKGIFISGHYIYFNKLRYNVITKSLTKIDYIPFQLIMNHKGYDTLLLSTGYADVKVMKTNNEKVATLFYGKRVYDCKLDENELIWIGTKEGLIVKKFELINSKDYVNHFFSGFQVENIKIINNSVWAVVNRKNLTLIKNSKEFILDFKGTIVENKVINDYILIENKIIILCTNRGLFKISLNENYKVNSVVSIVSEYDNVNKEYVGVGLSKDKLFFSTLDMISYVKVNLINDISNTSFCNIHSINTNLRILNLPSSISIRNLKLNNEENLLELNFTNSYLFKNEIQNQYKYKLIYNNSEPTFRYTSSNSLRFENLKHGKYSLIVHSQNIYTGWSKPYVLKFEVFPKFTETVQFSILLVILIFFVFTLIVFFIYKSNRKKIKFLELSQKNENYKLQLLRSQLNPHFLFNSINSLKSLIYLEKTSDALLYTDKLSVFLRDILKLSLEDSIYLKDEIKVIINYLEYEKIRLGKLLSYNIIYEEIHETIKIPTNVLQPILENSIKYSKVENNEEVKINILIFIKDGVLRIEISDNGKSNLKTFKNSSSFSLLSIEKRIINHNNDRKICPLRLDEIKENSNKVGTLCVISIKL